MGSGSIIFIIPFTISDFSVVDDFAVLSKPYAFRKQTQIFNTSIYIKWLLKCLYNYRIIEAEIKVDS
jgi:hypothetical protein